MEDDNYFLGAKFVLIDWFLREDIERPGAGGVEVLDADDVR